MAIKLSKDKKSEYELAKEYFDQQLEKIGLKESQILEQSLEELSESLNRVNDALANPDGYGELFFKYSANAGLIVADARSEHHRKIGVLPFLLERKKLIVERIKELSTGKKLETLQDLVNEITDSEIKNKLKGELQSLQNESKEYSEKSRDIASAETEEKLKLQQQIDQQKLELLERKTKIWQSYLERESVATIVGGMILIALTITLIASMFLKIESTEIINNGFLVILGYFFGQSVKSNRKTT